MLFLVFFAALHVAVQNSNLATCRVLLLVEFPHLYLSEAYNKYYMPMVFVIVYRAAPSKTMKTKSYIHVTTYTMFITGINSV